MVCLLNLFDMYSYLHHEMFGRHMSDIESQGQAVYWLCPSIQLKNWINKNWINKWKWPSLQFFGHMGSLLYLVCGFPLKNGLIVDIKLPECWVDLPNEYYENTNLPSWPVSVFAEGDLLKITIYRLSNVPDQTEAYSRDGGGGVRGDIIFFYMKMDKITPSPFKFW